MEQREGPKEHTAAFRKHENVKYIYTHTEKRKILLIGESPKDTDNEERELVVNGLHELVELRVGT